MQLCTAYSIKYFDRFARLKYRFIPYSNPSKPTIFYGCYTSSDVNRIKNHRGPKVLIWGGSDIMKKNIRLSATRIKNLKHIAQSSFIVNDLKKLKVPCIYLPFAPTIDERMYQPVTKGNCVYVYTNACNQEFYGSSIYRVVMRRMPHIKFILASTHSALSEAKQKKVNCQGILAFSSSQMPNVYSKCFLGLRLTKHDGISATVQELGMMGIKTIHNGSTPSCINYTNVKDIIEIIEREKENIGSIDHDVAESTKQHLRICDELIPYLFKNIEVDGEEYVMMDYNYWVSQNRYIRKKNRRWVIYDNSHTHLYENYDVGYNVPPISGWLKIQYVC